MTKKPTNLKVNISRRSFLGKSAIVLGGTYILGTAACNPVQRKVFQRFDVNEAPVMGLNKFDADLWLSVEPDNTILLRCPKVEMGQGIFTGAALLVAEELETHPSKIKVVHSSSKNAPTDPLGTGGSSSMSGLFKPVRKAAATIRETLKNAAAGIWNTNADNIQIANGYLMFGSEQLSFIDVIQQTKNWKVPGKAPKLKPKSSFKYIGKDFQRVDLIDKVMGAPIFGIDHEIEGQLYAVTVETPYIGGHLKSVNFDQAKGINGVLDVFQQEDYIVVVAKNRYYAEMGARKVEAEWAVDKKWDQKDIDAIVKVGNGKFESIQKEGNTKARFEENDGEIFEQEYFTPAAAHAFMEPKGSIAHYQKNPERLLVITGTQQPMRDRNELAKRLNIKKKNIEIQCTFLGGGFGGRFYLNKIIQAALISKKIGRPIHLLSTRESDFRNNYYRPSTHHVVKMKLKDNKIVAAQHEMATDDMIMDYMPKIAEALLGADPSSAHGALFEYSIPHRTTNCYRVDTPYITGIWRGIGILATAFAKECFLDEMAEQCNMDPTDLRKAYLQDHKDERHHRMISLIDKVKAKAKWDSKKPKGIGRGFACSMDRQTVVAAIIEVTVSDNAIKVEKVTLGIDAGLIVNPEGVRQQCEGCAVMGISSALHEGLYLKDGKVACTNFNQYPVAVLKDIPPIEIVLQETGDEVFGVGEPPMAPIVPAIANAVYDAVGVRLRSLPLTRAMKDVVL